MLTYPRPQCLVCAVASAFHPRRKPSVFTYSIEKKKHTNQQHSPRCLGRRPGTHQQCGRDSRQAVTGRIQDAVLQVQQHVEQADAERGMFWG
jgi:hypothetical protein